MMVFFFSCWTCCKEKSQVGRKIIKCFSVHTPCTTTILRQQNSHKGNTSKYNSRLPLQFYRSKIRLYTRNNGIPFWAGGYCHGYLYRWSRYNLCLSFIPYTVFIHCWKGDGYIVIVSVHLSFHASFLSMI